MSGNSSLAQVSSIFSTNMDREELPICVSADFKRSKARRAESAEGNSAQATLERVLRLYGPWYTLSMSIVLRSGACWDKLCATQEPLAKISNGAITCARSHYAHRELVNMQSCNR